MQRRGDSSKASPVESMPPRSMVVTAFAWLVILASAALIPISLITLLMMIVGGDGTASATLPGFVNVVVVPPVTFVAGIGLLRRKPWARYYLLALFTVVLAFNVYAFFRANPEPTQDVSPSGVPTTVLPTDRTMFVPIIALCVGAIVVLVSRRARLEFARTATTPAALATLVLASVTAATKSAAADGVPNAIAAARVPAARSGNRMAALLAGAVLLALAGGMTWLVYNGVVAGETVLPSKLASQRRPVLRADEPISFWLSIGTYAFVAIGSVGLVVWGVVQTRRGR